MGDLEKNRTVRGDSDELLSDFEALLRRGRNGEQEAIGLLLSKYRNYLLLIANQDLDQKMRAKMGASDLVQQSMILAQQNFGQFRGASEIEFKSWIRKILQNDLLERSSPLCSHETKTNQPRGPVTGFAKSPTRIVGPRQNASIQCDLERAGRGNGTLSWRVIRITSEHH